MIQATALEVGYHTGSPSNGSISRFRSGLQSAAVIAGCPAQELGFQPQVLSTVRTALFEGSHVLGPEPKVLQQRVRTIRQADNMAGTSVTFVQKPKETNQTSTKKTSTTKKNPQSRTSVFERLCSPLTTTVQWTIYPRSVISCKCR